MARAQIDYLILDSLADDIESLQQILSSVERAVDLWHITPSDKQFTRPEIILSLTRLVAEKLIEVVALNPDGQSMSPCGLGVQPQGNFDDYWFQLTPHGRIIHSDWTPPPERASDTRFAT